MRLASVVFAALICTRVFAEARIDASSEATFNQSLELMKGELPSKKATELNAAVMALPFAGMKSVKDTPPDGIVKLDIKKLDGLTADQIIELARKTVSVKLIVGPPPGLPQKFKERLPPIADQGGVSPLAGTSWEVTDNINGHTTAQRVTLQADGKVNDGASTNGRWEQAGSAVKIAFNDDYAVYLGTLDATNSMQGSAANVNGSDWNWTAVRVDSR